MVTNEMKHNIKITLFAAIFVAFILTDDETGCELKGENESEPMT